MRVIAVRTLKLFWDKHSDAEKPLRSWHQEVTKAMWRNHGQLKAQFTSASVITAKRVIFNIKGNSYRLIIDIEYRLQIVFIVWVGTHHQYDRIDPKNIGYDKAN